MRMAVYQREEARKEEAGVLKINGLIEREIDLIISLLSCHRPPEVEEEGEIEAQGPICVLRNYSWGCL